MSKYGSSNRDKGPTRFERAASNRQLKVSQVESQPSLMATKYGSRVPDSPPNKLLYERRHNLPNEAARSSVSLGQSQGLSRLLTQDANANLNSNLNFVRSSGLSAAKTTVQAISNCPRYNIDSSSGLADTQVADALTARRQVLEKFRNSCRAYALTDRDRDEYGDRDGDGAERIR